jgi:hypothetical protein
MTLDNAANFILLTASGGYDVNAYTLTMVSIPANLPAGNCNLVFWNSTDYPDPSKDPHAEIDRLASWNGNVITLVNNGSSRTAQEGTTATAKNIPGKTYSLMLGITAKMITDIQANLQQPWKLVDVDGTIDGVNTVFTLHGGIEPFDWNSVDVNLDHQPQLQGIDYEGSDVTITYITPPDISLAGQPHKARYQ